MKRTDAFPTKYLSKDDVKSPLRVTFRSVDVETLGQGDDQENKPVAFWNEDIKPMVINATNWMVAESIYGDDSDSWIGKAIEIWVDPSVSYGGKRIGGLRLREVRANDEKHITTADLLARFNARLSEALALGVDTAQFDLPANPTNDVIIAAGKALKAAIDKANEF